MSAWWGSWLPFVFALIVSALAPFVIRPLLLRRGVVDVACERSSHTGVAVRGLGIGVWIACNFSWLMFFAVIFLVTEDLPTRMVFNCGVFFIVFNLTAALGLYEDLRGLSVKIRSLGQLTIAAIAVVGFLFAPAVLLGGEPIKSLQLTVGLAFFGIFYISSYINVANFMDGVNGISGMHGIISGALFVLTGVLYRDPAIMHAGAVVLAAFLGYILWNVLGYGFLGDVGSYLLGGSVIGISFWIIAAYPEVWLVAISPTVVYFGDVGWTLLKRVRAGEKWHTPHKQHVYQRLQQQGLSHVAAAAVTSVATVLTMLIAVTATFVVYNPFAQLLALTLGFGIVVLYLCAPRLHKRARHARVA